MSFETEVHFSKGHPSFAGHFLGNPIVAGVLILDQVRHALQQWQPGAVIEALPNVKFATPLLPEQALSIRLEEAKGKTRFRCECDGQLVAHGELRLK
ncbi:hydroxymyristoyl-ACP dehydratase [Pseudomonadota bacterium]